MKTLHDDDGSLVEEGGRPVVRLERRLRQPPPKVWAALTTPERLAEWLGTVEIDPRVGGRFHIDFGIEGAPLMPGEITVFDPPRVLETTWPEPWFTDEIPRLRFEVAADGEGSRLTLTHTFPAGYDPLEYLAGWAGFVENLLASLEGTPNDWRADGSMDDYTARLERYRAALSAD